MTVDPLIVAEAACDDAGFGVAVGETAESGSNAETDALGDRASLESFPWDHRAVSDEAVWQNEDHSSVRREEVMPDAAPDGVDEADVDGFDDAPDRVAEDDPPTR